MEMNHRALCKVFIPILLFTLPSCSAPDYLPEKELLTFIQDEYNGLVKTKTIGPYKITIQYRPTDLVILQEIGDKRDHPSITKAATNFQDYAYFIMSLEVDGGSALYKSSTDQNMFSENLQTIAFGMNERVSLITSAQDTVQVADYIFDRTFGMGSTMLMFVFNKEKLADSDWFTFNLKEFGFRTGDQRFRFETDDIKQTPRLEALKPWIKSRNRTQSTQQTDTKNHNPISQ